MIASILFRGLSLTWDFASWPHMKTGHLLWCQRPESKPCLHHLLLTWLWTKDFTLSIVSSYPRELLRGFSEIRHVKLSAKCFGHSKFSTNSAFSYYIMEYHMKSTWCSVRFVIKNQERLAAILFLFVQFLLPFVLSSSLYCVTFLVSLQGTLFPFQSLSTPWFHRTGA